MSSDISSTTRPQDSLPAGELSEIRRSIIAILKREGSASIAELARELGVSYETGRQHVTRLQGGGWIEPQRRRLFGQQQPEDRRPEGRRTAGRPTRRYRLTSAGDHLFPKHYDLLSVELIDAVVGRFGIGGLGSLLQDLTDARVRRWAPLLEGLSVADRARALTSIYFEEDPFMRVEENDDGELRLIEHNCPFLNVAKERPGLCSLTVSVLTRLLGHRVVREKRFQNGDGECVFRVLLDRPVAADEFGFEFEEAS